MIRSKVHVDSSVFASASAGFIIMILSTCTATPFVTTTATAAMAQQVGGHDGPKDRGCWDGAVNGRGCREPTANGVALVASLIHLTWIRLTRPALHFSPSLSPLLFSPSTLTRVTTIGHVSYLPFLPPSFLSLARCERISAISPFFSVTFFSHMLSLHRSHKKESSSTTRGACPVPHSMDGSVVLTRGAALPGRHGVAHQQSASSVVQAGQECARLLTHPSHEKA